MWHWLRRCELCENAVKKSS